MSRSPSRDRSTSRAAGRTNGAAAGGGGGGTPAAGPRLLGTYVTPVGTDEATPRVITLTNQATPGRTVFAIGVSSSTLTIASPWTSLASGSAGTVYNSYKLAPADNASGITTVTVTQGTAYPFPMIIFEDDVDTVQSAIGPGNTVPSSGTWNGRAGLSFTSTWRSVWIWAAQTYQAAPNTDVTAYSNGLTEIADTGVSSIYNSAHDAWYAGRMWAATVDGLSGAVTPSASIAVGNIGTGWVSCIAYTVLP